MRSYVASSRWSVDAAGRDANGASRTPVIAADAAAVAFTSDATDVVGRPTYPGPAVYLAR